MFQKSQNNEYVDIILKRLEDEIPLVWTSQFCNIIKNFKKNNIETLNDIGCQVGQFYKAIKYHNLDFINYKGFDIEENYLIEFRKKFIECKCKTHLLDVSNQNLPEADFSVMSATLEHIENYEQSLINILKSTKKISIIRTFLGLDYKNSFVWKNGAKTFYQVQQFKFEDLFSIYLKENFTMKIVQDEFTKSIPQIIDIDYRNKEPILRTQYIILGEKICK